MRFAAKDTLTEEEIQPDLRAVIKDGMASTSMVTLTGGALLVAFSLRLGASNVVKEADLSSTPLPTLGFLLSLRILDRVVLHSPMNRG